MQCFTVRSVIFLDSKELLRHYFSYFHSVITYGIIFWEDLSDSNKAFIIQRKVIQIMASAQKRWSCRILYKKSHVLPLASEYLLVLIMFIIDNLEMFQTYSEVYVFSTRYHHNHHRPATNLEVLPKRSLLCFH